MLLSSLMIKIHSKSLISYTLLAICSPIATEVLLHPMFWNSEMRLSFLRDASDRVELENREADSEILKAMESTVPVAIGGKWDEKLEPVFITNIGRYRRYKYDSIRDLLRVIRNKLNHYRELPPEIQVLLTIESLKHHYTHTSVN